MVLKNVMSVVLSLSMLLPFNTLLANDKVVIEKHIASEKQPENFKTWTEFFTHMRQAFPHVELPVYSLWVLWSVAHGNIKNFKTLSPILLGTLEMLDKTALYGHLSLFVVEHMSGYLEGISKDQSLPEDKRSSAAKANGMALEFFQNYFDTAYGAFVALKDPANSYFPRIGTGVIFVYDHMYTFKHVLGPIFKQSALNLNGTEHEYAKAGDFKDTTIISLPDPTLVFVTLAVLRLFSLGTKNSETVGNARAAALVSMLTIMGINQLPTLVDYSWKSLFYAQKVLSESKNATVLESKAEVNATVLELKKEL